MVDMVSQFEVDDLYSQINYQDRPVRVSPLKYASIIKWLTNNSEGIPAYMKIDMATQDTELVKLDEGMKYTTSDHFNRNIYRHLRFRYPTYIFNDLSFEVDEEGTPYWICPVKKYNIGLFGGVTIGRVVLCNAITGETEDYAVEDAPQWIDRAYSADLLVELYDYHGTLQHGFINSVFGQKDCLVTTDGYNYLAIDDDVWVYTGVTSITGDQSNVGFVLMNQRTMETRFMKWRGDGTVCDGFCRGTGAEPALYRYISSAAQYIRGTDIFYSVERRCRSGEDVCHGQCSEISDCGYREYRERV